MDHFPKAVVTNKENTLKPGPWKNKKSSTNSSSTVSSNHCSSGSITGTRAISSTPGFQGNWDFLNLF